MNPIFAKGNQRTLPRLKRLRQQAQADKAARVVTRINAIMLSLQNHTNGQIAQLLQADRSRVHAWISSWNEHGIDGLFEGHRSGRPSELSGKDVERIRDIVESRPVAYGLNTGIWTSPVVAQIIRDEFDVDYHPARPAAPENHRFLRPEADRPAGAGGPVQAEPLDPIYAPEPKKKPQKKRP